MSTDTKPLSQIRKQWGYVDRSVMFPVSPAMIELPLDYMDWLAELKQSIAKERLRIVLASNSAMVLLYWDIGKRILDKQQTQGWGARIIDRLAHDLRE